MNKDDVKALIKEWMHKPPGARPLLEKAIAEQYRKSREGRWGIRDDTDALAAWLSQASADLPINGDREVELENRIAALLVEESDIDATDGIELPIAAKRDTQQQAKPATRPSDEEIALRVKSILERVDRNREGQTE